jgi:hypothetical protein
MTLCSLSHNVAVGELGCYGGEGGIPHINTMEYKCVHLSRSTHSMVQSLARVRGTRMTFHDCDLE